MSEVFQDEDAEHKFGVDGLNGNDLVFQTIATPMYYEQRKCVRIEQEGINDDTDIVLLDFEDIATLYFKYVKGH